ncbi:hypothetical protein PMAYCL1PPCAC_29983, partial [Pristionchus mayeri]
PPSEIDSETPSVSTVHVDVESRWCSWIIDQMTTIFARAERDAALPLIEEGPPLSLYSFYTQTGRNQ